MTIESAEKKDPIEVARNPEGLVNEIYSYADEIYDERKDVYRYDLLIIRIGGKAMTDAEIEAAVAEARK